VTNCGRHERPQNRKSQARRLINEKLTQAEIQRRSSFPINCRPAVRSPPFAESSSRRVSSPKKRKQKTLRQGKQDPRRRKKSERKALQIWNRLCFIKIFIRSEVKVTEACNASLELIAANYIVGESRGRSFVLLHSTTERQEKFYL
jgi:hypothetical protein